MNKKEINEIKKQFTPERCTITRICGCYVDGDKNKKTELAQTFLTLTEEENFKYFSIFKGTLSGTIGRNLYNMEFPNEQEAEGGTQEFLMRLKNSKLENDEIVEEFYDKVISTYNYGENYYIILVYGVYDVPGQTSDGIENEDASDYVYDYVLCSICPVKLTEAGLCYNEKTNNIESRIRDWLVAAPVHGFLFPAFNDRSTDVHGLLYYTKNSELMQEDFIDQTLGCAAPLSYKAQQETFQDIIENSLGEQCDFKTVKTIHENLNEYVEARKDAPEPPELDKMEMRKLLEDSGVKTETIATFDEAFDTIVSNEDKPKFTASTVASTKSFDIKMPDVVIKVKPERTDLVETKMIDGRQYIVIEVNDSVEVNGINIRNVNMDTGEIMEE
ncbi:MAG: DUF4317 domain-containing protein [Lachnospiraceae bacterium]|nr:DUF4317 domain-containing protein [Lachnospiraceae bacterium]